MQVVAQPLGLENAKASPTLVSVISLIYYPRRTNEAEWHCANFVGMPVNSNVDHICVWEASHRLFRGAL